MNFGFFLGPPKNHLFLSIPIKIIRVRGVCLGNASIIAEICGMNHESLDYRLQEKHGRAQAQPCSTY